MGLKTNNFGPELRRKRQIVRSQGAGARSIWVRFESVTDGVSKNSKLTTPPLSGLEQKFSELLDALGIEFPAPAFRPVARNERLAEEVLGTFLEVSGKQLVKVLKGEPTFSPLHQLEVLVSLFYSTIDDVYIGVDSHPPSLFLKIHPFLLETLTEDHSNRDEGPFIGPTDHEECHAPRRIRIIPLDEKELKADYAKHADAAADYFNQHKEGVTLLSVPPAARDQAKADILRGEWTGDMGIWLNTAALLFAPSMDAVNNRLQLELVYSTEQRFKRCLRYVRRLIEQARRVDFRNGQVSTEPLTDDERDHLLWDLDTMFEPALADVWDEFVAAPKRVDGIGPFVESHVGKIGVEKAKILDAATGTGCDSIFLLQRGHEVTSNEIEHRLITHAQEAALESGQELDVRRFDWRHFEFLDDPETYDVVLALGNSLSCLSTEADVRRVLARFALLVRPNGLLIVDERNYPVIFKNRRRMSRRDFRFPGRVVYCSDSIQARPRDFPKKPGEDHQMLTLEYLRDDGTTVGRFDVLPFKDGQLEKLLIESGFRSIERFYNLQEPNGNREESEFITYVASRSFEESAVASGTRVDVVVVFSDISGSTAAKAQLGEGRYAREREKHEHRVQKLVAVHSGKIRNDTGDGFLISFPSAASAIECMREAVAEPGSRDLTVRAGINQGLAVLEDEHGNLRGREVDVAARICDQARPNHLIVDDRIKLAAPEYEWISVGTVDLKGAGARQLWRLAE